MQPKRSKAEILAKFKERQVQKFGGEKAFKSHIREGRKSIGKALSKYKEPSHSEKSSYQHRTGRAYSE